MFNKQMRQPEGRPTKAGNHKNICVHLRSFAFSVSFSSIYCLQTTLQTGFYKHIQTAIEHSLGVTGFHIGTQILDA
jgi:hypothetical protein